MRRSDYGTFRLVPDKSDGAWAFSSLSGVTLEKVVAVVSPFASRVWLFLYHLGTVTSLCHVPPVTSLLSRPYATSLSRPCHWHVHGLPSEEGTT